MILLNKTEVTYVDPDTIEVTRLIDGKLYYTRNTVKTVKGLFTIIKAFESYTNDEFKKESKCLTNN